MSVTATADATENMLRASQLPPTMVESLKTQYEKATELLGAGWHGPTDIQTLVGLEGQFLWAEEWFNIRMISFVFDSDKVGYQGTYKLISGVFTVEEGIFYCVPNNPAIGWAFVSLMPQGGAARWFIVAGMFTDNQWKIINLLLNKVRAKGPIQPPFSAVRIG